MLIAIEGQWEIMAARTLAFTRAIQKSNGQEEVLPGSGRTFKSPSEGCWAFPIPIPTSRGDRRWSGGLEKGEEVGEAFRDGEERGWRVMELGNGLRSKGWGGVVRRSRF